MTLKAQRSRIYWRNESTGVVDSCLFAVINAGSGAMAASVETMRL